MDDVRDQIIATLSKNNKYLTISEISQQSNLDRHTVAKYLGVFEVLGKVRKIEHGNAKKYHLITSVPVSGLIDISTDLIIIVNKDLKVQYINSAACEKLGLNNDSILGERIDLLKIDLFSSPEIIEGLKNYSPNKVFRTEINHSDDIFYSITILELALDPGKNLIAITAEDMTEKRNRDLAIIESEEKYKALFIATTDPVILVDQESGRIIDVNPAACQVYGYEYDIFLSLKIEDVSAEPDKTLQYIQNPIPLTQKRYHRHHNGSMFPVEISAAVIEIKGKKIIISTIRDISERILAEEALFQSRLNLNTFFNSIDDYLFVLDEKGCILEINNTVIKRLGYARHDLIGSPVIYLHPPDLREAAALIISDMIAGKTSVCPIPIMCRSGEKILVETRISRGLWDGIPAFFGVSKDISQISISEEKFSKSFHRSAMPRAISTFEDGRFIDVNDSFLETLGYSRQEVIGKTSADLMLFQSSAERKKILQLAEYDRPVRNLEICVRTKTGSVRYGLFSASRIQIGDENLLLTSMVDITELRMTEQALRESEGRYRMLLETLSEGIWMIDEHAVTTYVNRKMEQMLGYNPGEMIGRHLFSFMNEAGGKIAESNLARRTQGIAEDHEFEFLKKDGSLMYATLETIPILGSDGKYQGAIAGIIDITIQKKKEQALVESEEKYRVSFNANPDAVFLIDQCSGIICDANSAASLMYGYTHEEFIRLKNTDLSAEPEKTQNTTNTPQQNIPLRYHIRKDGGVFPVEISANTLILQGVTFLLVTIRDISRHRYTEEMLGEANQKLSLLTDLTMHDISNHLTTIKLCQEKALASSDPTIVTEYIAMAQEGVSQMEATIGFTCEYENFQAISSGWQQVHMIIESSKSEVALGSVKVNNQIPDDLDVYADPIIRKAFTTILENAIRHGECITGILISCLEVDKNMIITCEDDGVGILAEEKEQIFEHGYGKNTGIGLFLAREILSITGISIRECGVFGKGAKFEISVPEGAYRLDARILTDTKGTQ